MLSVFLQVRFDIPLLHHRNTREIKVHVQTKQENIDVYCHFSIDQLSGHTIIFKITCTRTLVSTSLGVGPTNI